MEKVGTKLNKTTQANRDVYVTSDGENVSEKSIMVGIPAKRVGDASKGFKPYAVTDEDKE